MKGYDDSLRGYGHEIYVRDGFICQYCGADGKKSFEVWLTLSCDHLLPKGHPNRNERDYIVTACQFCNTTDNFYFVHAEKRKLVFDDRSPAQLTAQRKPYVEAVREKYREFWDSNVNTEP